MRKEQLVHAAGLGFLMACAWIGLTLGAEIHRFAEMAWAVEDMEQCREIGDLGAAQMCADSAYARLQAAKGGR